MHRAPIHIFLFFCIISSVMEILGQGEAQQRRLQKRLSLCCEVDRLHLLYSQFWFVPLSLSHRILKFPSEALGKGEVWRYLLTITIFYRWQWLAWWNWDWDRLLHIQNMLPVSSTMSPSYVSTKVTLKVEIFSVLHSPIICVFIWSIMNLSKCLVLGMTAFPPLNSPCFIPTAGRKFSKQK